MNNQEYVIINKTAIQKRIDELENKSKELYYREGIDEYDFAKEELENVLSQSTPLIPGIEKAFDAGVDWQEGGTILYPDRHGYISNLKLDI